MELLSLWPSRIRRDVAVAYVRLVGGIERLA